MKLQTMFMILILLVFGASFPVVAQEPDAMTEVSAKDDYVTCWKQPCVFVVGSEWSEQNPNGVGVAVRMGVKPAVTDDQIKMVLTRDLAKYGVTNIKFFYEQNDAPANLIVLHVRGGSEGPFLIGSVREKIAFVARRALNDNPLFRSD